MIDISKEKINQKNMIDELFYFQFYQELLYIQATEMAAPSPGSYLTPAGQVMPAYSGRGRPPLNPQHSALVCFNLRLH